MTDDSSLLSNYKTWDKKESNIYSVTDSIIKVKGIGILKLTLNYNDTFKVVNIPTFHCSNIVGTYISEMDLVNEGVDYRSIDGDPHLFWKDGFVKLHRNRKSVEIPKCLVVDETPRGGYIAGIHEALGHIQKSKAIQSLKEGYVYVANDEDESWKKADSCLDCTTAKARRCDHIVGSRNKYIVNIPFYNVCSDLMFIGNDITDTYIDSNSAFSYVLTIVCEYSRYVFAFALKSKAEVLPYIKRVNSYIRKRFDSSIRSFHTDRGTEYLSKEIQDYFDSQGIVHTTTNGYASMETGQAERLNLTLRNDIKANLLSSGLDTKYWIYILEYVVSIRNKTIKDGTGKSPEGVVMNWVNPDDEPKEIFHHEFKTLGRHGIWYDVGSKRSDLKSYGHNCFYLGPASYPCLGKAWVRDGDRVLVFKRDKENKMRAEVIETTNVVYTFPPITYKQCTPDMLGLEDTNVLKETNPSLHSGRKPLDLMTNPPPMENMMFVNFGPINGESYGELPVKETNKTINTEPIIQEESESEVVPNTMEPSHTTGEMKDNPVESDNNTEIDHSVQTSEVECTENSNNTGSTIEADTSKPSEVTTQNNSQDGENIENALDNGSIKDIVETTQAKLVTYEVDKNLQDFRTPHGTVTLPEGRLLRSRYSLNHVSAIKLAAVLDRLPGEMMFPDRLIYQVVRNDPEEGPGWIKAYNTEKESHIHQGSWDPKPIRTGDKDILRKSVQVQIICTEKRPKNGVKPKKVRFVLRGDKQDPSTYKDTFSPTLSYDLFRILVAEAVDKNCYLILIDIKTAYLNAPIDYELYVELPKCMEDKPSDLRKGEKVVHRLRKAVYGLKQSGRQWYKTLSTWLLSKGFKERGDVPCVLVKTNDTTGEILLMIGFFVDDMIISGKTQVIAEEFVKELETAYELKRTVPDNNGFRDILGINIREKRDKKTGILKWIDLSLSKYISQLIEGMGLSEDFRSQKTIMTPMTPGFQFDPSIESSIELTGEQLAKDVTWCREVVGALQYIAMAARPDLSYAANYMARFVTYPHPKIKKELMRILRYTYITRGKMIRFSRMDRYESNRDRLITYSDADHAGDPSSRKSTLGAVFMMNGGPVSWYAKIAKFVATSSADAEVAAMVEAGNKLSYLREVMVFLKVLGLEYSRWSEVCPNSGGALLKLAYTDNVDLNVDQSSKIKPLVVFVDNTAALDIARKGTTSGKTKHIGIRAARAHEIMEKEHIEYIYKNTKAMLADIFTKPVSVEVMKTLLPQLLVDE